MLQLNFASLACFMIMIKQFDSNEYRILSIINFLHWKSVSLSGKLTSVDLGRGGETLWWTSIPATGIDILPTTSRIYELLASCETPDSNCLKF